ncbi:16574_t:CDS:2 [Acaulospora morrowiae]|uniref:carbonic anhydrase n=1 Tax=Acaulospora morrowiae TaxID=94023 RepID=A0A9N8ZAT3_9GLOM|nr:16574_t:CDS:2 [Acaulospora morrowiae]
MRSFALLLLFSLTISVVISANTTVDFSYSGPTGPLFWDTLPGSSEICRVGKHQSPIDISLEGFTNTGKCADHKKEKVLKVKFHDAHNVEATNTGNTVEISKEGGLPANLTLKSGKYELAQFHFHTPSEHRVGGVHSDVEAHFVFKTKEANPKISVVAVFYNVGKEENKFLKPIIETLPLKEKESKDIDFIKLSSVLSDINFLDGAYTYSGSLTTPPCTEGVTWWVSKPAQTLSSCQFHSLREVTGFNSRFTQLRSDVC